MSKRGLIIRNQSLVAGIEIDIAETDIDLKNGHDPFPFSYSLRNKDDKVVLRVQNGKLDPEFETNYNILINTLEYGNDPRITIKVVRVKIIDDFLKVFVPEIISFDYKPDPAKNVISVKSIWPTLTHTIYVQDSILYIGAVDH